MFRFRHAIVAIFLAAPFVGCGGEDQPNAPAKLEEVNSAEFAKKTSDMMNSANSGMNKKAGTSKAPKAN